MDFLEAFCEHYHHDPAVGLLRACEARLVSALRAIHQTDLALKGEGGLRPDLALERLVIGLAA